LKDVAVQGFQMGFVEFTSRSFALIDLGQPPVSRRIFCNAERLLAVQAKFIAQDVFIVGIVVGVRIRV
jgi:hypothetical protein